MLIRGRKIEGKKHLGRLHTFKNHLTIIFTLFFKNSRHLILQCPLVYITPGHAVLCFICKCRTWECVRVAATDSHLRCLPASESSSEGSGDSCSNNDLAFKDCMSQWSWQKQLHQSAQRFASSKHFDAGC